MTVRLPTGKEMPLLALGTFDLKPAEVVQTIKTAVLDVGYRHIDTATVYGNETQVGEALQEVFATGRVTREEIFLVTKCWMTWFRNVREACMRSLRRLNVDYLDLYLLHWPFVLKPNPSDPDLFVPGPNQQFDDFPLQKAWEQMEALVDEGLVKHIGISNWSVGLTRDLLSYARIKPVCNQFEVQPYNNQQKRIEFLQQNGIQTIAYRAIYPPETNSLVHFKKSIMEDPLVLSLSQKYGKSPAQILINWCFRRGYGVVIKTKTPSRLVENWEAQHFELSPEDTQALLSLPQGGSYNEPEVLFGFPLFS